MKTYLTGGLEYRIQHIRDGELLSDEVVHNLMPIEGMNYALNAMLKGGTTYNTWYIALYEGNYVPNDSATMSNIVSAATECTAYTEGARQALTLGTAANGAITNANNVAEFSMNATKTVYGCFISRTSVKNDNSNPPLLSVVRFSSAKAVVSGDKIRIIGGFSLTNI